jgi:hypothetical protein
VFEKERESLRRQGNWVWFLLVPVVCVGSYCVCGIGAVFGIAAVDELSQSSPADEPREHLATLATSMEAWCAEGGTAPRGFPPSAGPSPLAPMEIRQAFVPEGTFQELGFSPERVQYSYSIVTTTTDRSTLVAEGDLDVDGARSRFTVECRVTSGVCHCDPRPVIEDELE